MWQHYLKRKNLLEMKNLLFSLLICLPAYGIFAQKNEGENPYRFAFYNVENLFDVIDNPATADDEFTPEGKKAYTEDRYQEKLKNLARVLTSGDLDGAEVIGLAEVENKKVLEDLLKQEKIKDYGYKIVHQDSRDERGIDVAAIYRSDLLELREFKYLPIQLFNTDRPNTRDILHLSFKKPGKGDFEIFYNHWPSRWGGEEVTRSKRIQVAQQLRAYIEENLEWADFVFIMGDFNDQPKDVSLSMVLGADTYTFSFKFPFFNLSQDWQNNGEGTYSYKGNWEVLDQIIVADHVKTQASLLTAKIIKDDYLIYTSESSGLSAPNRSYGGENYYGGYSDHLPILVSVVP